MVGKRQQVCERAQQGIKGVESGGRVNSTEGNHSTVVIKSTHLDTEEGG